jgi:hypothetical protein
MLANALPSHDAYDASADIDQQTQACVHADGCSPRLRLRLGTGTGPPLGMPLWGMMLHVANHGTQHGVEVTAMLTGLGQSPGDVDVVYYLARPLDARSAAARPYRPVIARTPSTRRRVRSASERRTLRWPTGVRDGLQVGNGRESHAGKGVQIRTYRSIRVRL